MGTRTIRISDEVWDEIAKTGKFGETEDDVLRRIFGIKAPTAAQTTVSPRPRGRYATHRMHAGVHNFNLVVSFDGGKEKRWKLPNRDDKAKIRHIRDEAVAFALEQGASDPGQTNAVRKALTDASYHLTR